MGAPHRTFLLLLVLAAAPGASSAQGQQHPLDPLTWQEHWTVLEVLRDAKHLDAETRFSMVNLVEPPKDRVWPWKAGDPAPRAAYAIVRQGARAFEAVVDLTARQVSSWQELTGAQANWLLDELFEATDLVKKDPAFVAALRRRGIEDLTFVDCVTVPPGYFGTEEQRGRRIGHVSCNEAVGVRNSWTRQISGVTAVVDMHEKKVLRVVDEGVVPMSVVSADYDPASVGKTREVPGPIHIEQPLGPGFRMDGHVVEWQKWRFHVRPDHRTGLVVSTVTYEDAEGARPVLYQGHLSEIFVPYMDPSFGWFSRNFLDAGEFTMAGLSKPLMAGRDCPERAVYLDALFAADNGRPKAVPQVVCLFERMTGDMSWRHWDGDVGPANSLLVDRLVPHTLPRDHPRRSIWVREPSIARREADAQLDMDMHRPALWRVVSASRTNHVGYPTSYQLMGGMNGMTLLSKDDPPRQRAGFIDHQLWVTPYDPAERYAAGAHPTLSTPGQGLPAWTKANRAIERTDIVLWHTIGMHHMVRAEDWPVMPVLWHSFELRPFDFFDRNPALDLPR
jgi:Cu2+-containing amine oxidase